MEGAALLGVSVPLDAEVVLGREPGCALRLPADDVSRRHARIAPAGDGHLVEDLGSTNGTFVNGVGIKEALLRGGETIRLGSTVITVAPPRSSPCSSLNRECMRSSHGSCSPIWKTPTARPHNPSPTT